MKVSALNLELLITEQTDTEQFTLRSLWRGERAPDEKSVWLFARAQKQYNGGEQTVHADCWVTWDCWILIGVEGVKSNLRDEIKKARRRQLRVPASKVARAPTFVLR